MMRIKTTVIRKLESLKKRVYSFLDSHPSSYILESGFGYLLRNATIDYEKAAYSDAAKEMPIIQVELPDSKVGIIDTAALSNSLYTSKPEDIKQKLNREQRMKLVNWSNSRQEQDRFYFFNRHPRVKQILDHTVVVAKVKGYKPYETASLMQTIGTLGSAVDRKIKIEKGHPDRGLLEILYKEDMQALRGGSYHSAEPKIKLHAVEVVGEIFKDREIVERVVNEI